jgi:peptidoglycan hydrolase-like protein with peptidoglycan-binding domain
MKHVTFIVVCAFIFGAFAAQSAHALTLAKPIDMGRVAPSPVVTKIGSTTATFTLPKNVQMSREEKSRVYFKYTEPERACIMIYPTPAECLPKTTEKGKSTVTVKDLKPNTKYSVVYKYDSTIRCITTPCPDNGFVSEATTFTTGTTSVSPTPSPRVVFDHNFGFGSRGEKVVALQHMLISRGHMGSTATGYFGPKTMRALMALQKAEGILQTGFAGPKTRAYLNGLNIMTPPALKTERFSGKVDSVSTACFADGECSITVDGKKVVTTTGWRIAIQLGSIQGVPSIGDAEKCIGSHAEVYAEKIEDGYTLYGNNDYYIKISSCGLEPISKPFPS